MSRKSHLLRFPPLECLTHRHTHTPTRTCTLPRTYTPTAVENNRLQVAGAKELTYPFSHAHIWVCREKSVDLRGSVSCLRLQPICISQPFGTHNFPQNPENNLIRASRSFIATHNSSLCGPSFEIRTLQIYRGQMRAVNSGIRMQ